MSARPRSVLGYFLVPRPGDAVKALILPVGFVLGTASVGLPSAAHLGQALLVWGALELLIYPARYQVNDMLGFESDQRAPGGDRGRLPGPLALKRQRLWSSGAVAALKLGLAGMVAVLAPSSTGLLLAVMTLAVFATAVVYEWLRAVATGRTGDVPTALTPGIVGIWAVIGAGYAIRGMGGVVLAAGLPGPLTTALAVAAWWSFGIAWVTSRWAVEATAYARSDGGLIVWEATAAQAREHLLALVRWLPARMDEGRTVDVGRWQAVSRTSLRAPWHVAAIAAGGFAVGIGWLYADPQITMVTLATGVLLGCGGSAVVAASRSSRAVPALAGAAAVATAGMVLRVDYAYAATLPWLAATIAQVSYLRQCRKDIGGFWGSVRGAVLSLDAGRAVQWTR